jgi:tetratricopeptide (TPR) repeat protein
MSPGVFFERLRVDSVNEFQTNRNMQNLLRQADRLIKERRTAEADELCQKLVRDYPELADGWVLLGRVYQQSADFPKMLEMAVQALTLQPNYPIAQLQQIDALIHCGRIGDALDNLQFLADKKNLSPLMLQHMGEFYTLCHSYENAEKCYRRALSAEPANTAFIYNLATAVIAIGRLDEAEDLLNTVISRNPKDFDAYYNRATLRKQTPEHNHLTEIRNMMNKGNLPAMGQVQLCFALAKELEDIGDHEKSFQSLKRGADTRRKHLSYRVEDDLDTMTRIAGTFDEEFFSRADYIGYGSDTPLFIIGLPRSGTTLVDRIISSHSDVESLGEVNHFALSLMNCVGPVTSKQMMVEKSANLNYQQLGQLYCDSLAGHDRSSRRLIDKTPINFLYIGLIASALPNAKIIHLRRNPMDSCYAMYKTLFRMGYPFSYDLEDLARYYLGYHNLMAHWRRVLPNVFLDVDYEDLVRDQEQVSRQMISHCGLDWQDNCLNFHLNSSPSATASAAQVRQPIYKTSLERWRSYENELAPLKNILIEGGLSL